MRGRRRWNFEKWRNSRLYLPTFDTFGTFDTLTFRLLICGRDRLRGSLFPPPRSRNNMYYLDTPITDTDADAIVVPVSLRGTTQPGSLQSQVIAALGDEYLEDYLGQ